MTFGHFAIAMPFAPMVSALFVNNRMADLQTRTTKATLALVCFVLFVGGGLLAIGPWLLALFGHEFKESYGILVVLVIGHAVSVSLVPVLLILNMTGHERTVAFWLTGSLLVNILLHFLLIPSYGPEGAAVATLCGLVLARIPLVFAAAKYLQIWPVSIANLRGR